MFGSVLFSSFHQLTEIWCSNLELNMISVLLFSHISLFYLFFFPFMWTFGAPIKLFQRPSMSSVAKDLAVYGPKTSISHRCWDFAFKHFTTWSSVLVPPIWTTLFNLHQNGKFCYHVCIYPLVYWCLLE